MTYTKINSLWSLENIRDCYVFCHEDKMVYNIDTKHQMKVHMDKWGYNYVSLTANNKIDKSIKYHKIVALALIHNGPYELIEHLDDNPLNNDVSNLKFSNKHNNELRMYKNGITNVVPSRYEICRYEDDGRCNIYQGTMKELSEQLKISINTLYDYYRSCSIQLKSLPAKCKIKYVDEIFAGTRSRNRYL